MKMFGKGWEQPVIYKRWAFVCSVLSMISKWTGHRVLNHKKHVAWERACGIN